MVLSDDNLFLSDTVSKLQLEGSLEYSIRKDDHVPPSLSPSPAPHIICRATPTLLRMAYVGAVCKPPLPVTCEDTVSASP